MKRFDGIVPKEYRGMRWSEMKTRAAFDYGYTVDALAGVVLGKRGQPLKPFVTHSGKVLVDMRLKLPYPFNKTKVSVARMIAFAMFGDEAFRPDRKIVHLDGDTTNVRGLNLVLEECPIPKKKRKKRPKWTGVQDIEDFDLSSQLFISAGSQYMQIATTKSFTFTAIALP